MRPSKSTCAVRLMLCLILAAVVIHVAEGRAWALGMEKHGGGGLPFGSTGNPTVDRIIDSWDRVYARDVNGYQVHFWRGDAAAFSKFLLGFAAVRAQRHELIIRPGPGRTQTFDRKELAIDWQLHVPGGLYGAVAQREKNTRVYLKQPTVTVYVGGKGGLDLSKTKIPAGVEVVTCEELVGRYLQGLKSPDPDVRCHAARGLGTLPDLAEFAILPLIDGLQDINSNVRTQTASTLGRFGVKAFAALPELIARLNDESVNVRRYAQAAIESIENAQSEADKKRRATLKQIAKFKQSASARPTTRGKPKETGPTTRPAKR